jgi:WD40 repeat protein
MGESSKRASESGAPDPKKLKGSDDLQDIPSDNAAVELPEEQKQTERSRHRMRWDTSAEPSHPGAVLLADTHLYVSISGTITVYCAATMNVATQIVVGCDYISNMSLSTDKKSLFFSCGGYRAGILNLDTKNTVFLSGHKREVACITQCEDTEVLTGSRDRTMRRWNMLAGDCLMIYRGHTSGVINSIIYDKATMRIFSASDDGTIGVWNRDHIGRRIRVIREHGCKVTSLVRVNEKMIAACDASDAIKIWDMDTLACIMTMSTPSYKRENLHDIIVSINIYPNRLSAITRTRYGGITKWNFGSGEITSVSSMDETRRRFPVAISPNGRIAITYANDGSIDANAVYPSYSYVVHEGVCVSDMNGKEERIYLLSNGSIYSWSGESLCCVMATSTCSLESNVRFTVRAHGYHPDRFIAPSELAANAWSEAIGAVAANLALRPDDRAHSANQMICRYRFNLLQTILVHLRNWKTRQWCIPREIVQVVGKYYF